MFEFVYICGTDPRVDVYRDGKLIGEMDALVGIALGEARVIQLVF